ncbi:MAG TPA: cytochrome c [Opitutaceae bacterium]|nr:cytochrome c [Opitutaceae bacterium]
MKLSSATAALLGALAAAQPARAFDLHRERGSPYDLALTGSLAGVPAGETRYARWSDLRALPTAELSVDGEFVTGPQVLTVVFLGDLLRALPAAPGADTLLATCADGYASVYTSGFISKYRPFLVLEINGKGPKDWPPPGLAYNPGPYVVTVSSELVPAAARFRDLEHKKPWGVTTLEVASYAERFRPLYAGKWASLSPSASDGREIWVNSCMSCHQGPAGIFGGTKAHRPFQVIAAYAGYDRAYFIKYVRDPKSLVACAKMEPHPRYTDEELSGLIAFVTAGQE